MYTLLGWFAQSWDLTCNLAWQVGKVTVQDTTSDSLSSGLDWGTVESISLKSDSTIFFSFTVDKTSIILKRFDKMKYRAYFVDWT